MSLEAVEFIRRFLLHVLARGFVKIRHFGFLSNRNPILRQVLLFQNFLSETHLLRGCGSIFFGFGESNLKDCETDI